MTVMLVEAEAAFVAETRGEGGVVVDDVLWMPTVDGVEVEVYAPTDERPRWHAFLTVKRQSFTAPLLDGPLRGAPMPEVVEWMRLITDSMPDEDDVLDGSTEGE